ncbi:hypothetical protein [Actinopolymorpha rutila]|uniref:Uncharacterized protein n=1 Tax=Actinopolymorpha rutila TaxID=446787 RepID=A0A852ZG54_9ACTN|nr:hypothetical protein [Actinopolymorpha rutila]NYH90662.1 hypothetical protein [Actinopolymorpha rutila]
MTIVRPRAAVLATIGAIAIATGAYFDWLGNRSPQQVRLQDLLTRPEVKDLAGQTLNYWTSMAAPLAVAGAIGILGALLLVRVLLWLSFLLGAATVGLWVGRIAFADGAAQFRIADVQPGAWIAAGGLLLVLLGAAALRRRAATDEEAGEYPTQALSEAV